MNASAAQCPQLKVVYDYDDDDACVMQNPVTTLAWLVAIFELLGPLVSLVIDTKNFCEPALRYKPILCLTVLSLVLNYVIALGHPHSWGNIFGQYEFPWSYKSLFAWTIILEGAIYGGLVFCMRSFLQQLQQRRCVPV